jgi:hypothetical protein
LERQEANLGTIPNGFMALIMKNQRQIFAVALADFVLCSTLHQGISRKSA